MAKTITIPNCRNPYVVIVNNKVYSYTAGETVEVPDEVAEVIEWHEKGHEAMVAPTYVPSGGSSNNYLPSYIDGSLTDITAEMLNGATKVGRYMFGYSGITSIEIPNSVVSIDKQAFYNCTSLGSATLPEGITDLPQEAFVNCKALTVIVIPNKVQSLGTNVFANCSGLTSVYLPETPPTLANINAFQNINSACVFYCKTQASLEAYQSAANWSTLAGTYTFVVAE